MENKNPKPFSIALKYLSDTESHGINTRLATNIEISTGYVSEIINGKKDGTEEVRRKIAQFFDMEYSAMISLGQWILGERDPAEYMTIWKMLAEVDRELTDVHADIVKTPLDGGTPIVKDAVLNRLIKLAIKKEVARFNLQTGIFLDQQTSEKHESIAEKILRLTDGRQISEDMAKDGFNLIPKYKARLAGGAGSLELSDQVESNFAFRKEWISKKPSSHLALFEVVGDSMAPFIQEGDIVLVDLDQNLPEHIVDGKTFAIREDHAIKIKRLLEQGGDLIVRSQDRDNFPDYVANREDFQLIGRVLWVGHEVR